MLFTVHVQDVQYIQFVATLYLLLGNKHELNRFQTLYKYGYNPMIYWFSYFAEITF